MTPLFTSPAHPARETPGAVTSPVAASGVTKTVVGWTLQQDDLLRKAVREGLPPQHVADVTGKSRTAVYARADQLGLSWRAEENRKIIEALREGLTYKGIARKLKTTTARIRRLIAADDDAQRADADGAGRREKARGAAWVTAVKNAQAATRAKHADKPKPERKPRAIGNRKARGTNYPTNIGFTPELDGSLAAMACRHLQPIFKPVYHRVVLGRVFAGTYQVGTKVLSTREMIALAEKHGFAAGFGVAA